MGVKESKRDRNAEGEATEVKVTIEDTRKKRMNKLKVRASTVKLMRRSAFQARV